MTLACSVRHRASVSGVTEGTAEPESGCAPYRVNLHQCPGKQNLIFGFGARAWIVVFSIRHYLSSGRTGWFLIGNMLCANEFFILVCHGS
jgi:hypothetical protein